MIRYSRELELQYLFLIRISFQHKFSFDLILKNLNEMEFLLLMNFDEEVSKNKKTPNVKIMCLDKALSL